MTERETKEVKRQKIVNKEMKRAKGLSSDMNTCQALVKPDCSKHNVAKSQGMQSALVSHLGNILKSNMENPEVVLASEHLVYTR